jgi:hypothetical protein
MASSRSPAENLARMESMIRTARSKAADVVAFPELTVTGAIDEDIAKADQALADRALRSIQRSALAEHIYVIFGMPYLVDGKKRNSAFVIGPDGTLLTRYDQLAVDRPQLFHAGSSPGGTWRPKRDSQSRHVTSRGTNRLRLETKSRTMFNVLAATNEHQRFPTITFTCRELKTYLPSPVPGERLAWPKAG